MSYRYHRYIERLTQHPWAVSLEKFNVIMELMRLRANGERLSDEAIAERLGGLENQPAEASVIRAADRPGLPAKSAGEGAVGVVPIHGVIAHRADSMSAMSGGTSVEFISRQLQRVAAEPGVKSVILDIASPGGSVEGVPELAAQIARLAAQKPVVAQINAHASSAAFWLASQAGEIVSTPSGFGGSIGVYMIHVDESGWLEKQGVKVTGIHAGENKLEGAPWLPLGEETQAHYQSQVDSIYRAFIADVAKGRGVTAAEVRDRYGKGRVFDAKQMLANGMIDRISTFDETVTRMLGRKGTGTMAASAPAAEHVAEAGEALTEMVAEAVADSATQHASDEEAILAALAGS